MPRSVNINVPQPTWKSGFARLGVSLHFDLWRGLVGAWSPGLGPTGITTLPDLSINKKNGTFTGSMTGADWVFDEGRYSLDLDGSDDFIDILIGGFPTVYPVSVSLWLKTSDATVSTRDPYGAGNSTTANNFLTIQMNSTHNLVVNAAAGGAGGGAVSPDSYNDGLGHHVVGLWRDADDRELFIDGVSVATNTNDIGGFPTLDRCYFGAINLAGSITQFWTGLLDELLIYNRNLTPAEILKLYQIGRGGIFQQRPMQLMKRRRRGFIPLQRKRIRYEILHNRG